MLSASDNELRDYWSRALSRLISDISIKSEITQQSDLHNHTTNYRHDQEQLSNSNYEDFGMTEVSDQLYTSSQENTLQYSMNQTSHHSTSSTQFSVDSVIPAMINNNINVVK